MTKTYIFDGHKITASSASHLVAIMHSHSFSPAVDDQAYMEDVAERICRERGAGSSIRTDAAVHFVEDLIADGHLKVVSVDED
jgi:hypothetical protein